MLIKRGSESIYIDGHSFFSIFSALRCPSYSEPQKIHRTSFYLPNILKTQSNPHNKDAMAAIENLTTNSLSNIYQVNTRCPELKSAHNIIPVYHLVQLEFSHTPRREFVLYIKKWEGREKSEKKKSMSFDQSLPAMMIKLS